MFAFFNLILAKALFSAIVEPLKENTLSFQTKTRSAVVYDTINIMFLLFLFHSCRILMPGLYSFLESEIVVSILGVSV